MVKREKHARPEFGREEPAQPGLNGYIGGQPPKVGSPGFPGPGHFAEFSHRFVRVFLQSRGHPHGRVFAAGFISQQLRCVLINAQEEFGIERTDIPEKFWTARIAVQDAAGWDSSATGRNTSPASNCCWPPTDNAPSSPAAECGWLKPVRPPPIPPARRLDCATNAASHRGRHPDGKGSCPKHGRCNRISHSHALV